MLIGLLNKSSIVSDEQVKLMASAIDRQMKRDVAPAWSMLPPKVYFISKNAFVPGGAVLTLVDDLVEAPDAEGYHSEDERGRFIGNIGVKTIPGTILTGQDSVASVVSHEVIELFLDPAINRWADAIDGYSYPIEGCDACQSGCYSLNGVSVSNFLLPNWFDNYATKDFDHLGVISSPFTLSSGGYTVRRKQGSGETQIFGKRPEWRQAIRSCKRV